MTTELLFKEECYKINSCIYEVNRKLGSGFLEAVYQEALEIELTKAGVPFESQFPIKIMYDGHSLQHSYVADIVCYNKILLEIKAVKQIAGEHKAQILNYLAATGFLVGLLVNFCAHPKAEIIRLVRTKSNREPPEPR